MNSGLWTRLARRSFSEGGDSERRSIHPKLRGRRLYLLLEPSRTRGSWERVLKSAIAGGVDLVQFREKETGDRDFLRLARRALSIARTRRVPLLVNDRVGVALALRADGVHLGADDLPIAEARALLGRPAIVGATSHSLAEARAAWLAGADYVSCGPMFATAAKPRLRPNGKRYLAGLLRECPVPVFAIGGITPANAAGVARLGAPRLAVGAAILGARDPASAARALRFPTA